MNSDEHQKNKKEYKKIFIINSYQCETMNKIFKLII